MMRLAGVVALLCLMVNPVIGFSLFSHSKNTQRILGKCSLGSNGSDDDQRESLSARLFELCEKPDQNDRAEFEKLLRELEPLSPVVDTAASPLMQKEWLLLWTTEKEINFFVDVGISAGGITQTLDGTVLTNNIPFRNGGSFGVVGSLSQDEQNAKRTNFEFESAKLDPGFLFGSLTLPPIGKGWFDTLYLDETLRLDYNSRNDIVVFKAT